jgi:hypothetical protein
MGPRVLVLLVSLVATVGCSNVRGETYTSSSRDKVLTDVAQSKLPDDDKRIFIAAMMRNALGNYPAEGKTVSQVIDEQRRWQAEQDAQAAAAHEAQLKVEAARAALVAQMQHAISVQPISKIFHERDYENNVLEPYEAVTFQFHNTGNKTIKGVKGTVTLTNSFNDEVANLGVEEGGEGGKSISLRPGAEITDELTFEMNEYENKDRTFRADALSSMRASWVPEQILFSDGSTLKAPD